MRKLTFLLLSAVLVCRLLIPFSSLAEECAVSARHAILYEPVTGAVLFEKDAHSPAPMASTTKIMTALVALKHGNLEDVLVIPREACGIEGSSV